jgi:hypothetical protein
MATFPAQIAPTRAVLAGDGAPPRRGSIAVLLSLLCFRAVDAATLSIVPGPTFCAWVEYAAGGVQFETIQTADLTHDGLADLILTTSGSHTMHMLAATLPRPEFNGPFQIASSPNSLHAAAGDLDGDGYQDLVCQGPENTIQVLYGRSTGPVATASCPIPARLITALKLTDVDNDGQLDVLVAAEDRKLIIVPGQGAAGFGPVREYSTGHGPCAIAVADFDGDGRISVAIANGRSPFLSIVRPNRSGPSPERQVDIRGPARALATSDFNQDGHPDLAALV